MRRSDIPKRSGEIHFNAYNTSKLFCIVGHSFLYIQHTIIHLATTGALLAISQSGETKDVFRAVKIGEEMGVRSISFNH